MLHRQHRQIRKQDIYLLLLNVVHGLLLLLQLEQDHPPIGICKGEQEHPAIILFMWKNAVTKGWWKLKHCVASCKLFTMISETVNLSLIKNETSMQCHNYQKDTSLNTK